MSVAQLAKSKLAARLGASPKQIDRELRAFSRAARVLSSRRPRLIEAHPNEWVALYEGEIAATAKTFRGLVSKLKKKGVSPNDAVVRYIDTSGRKMIL
jgi:hypothetical protein